MGSSDRRKLCDSLWKMDPTIWLSLALAVITLSTPTQSTEPRVVCYYTNWSVYRPGTAKYNPQNINPYLCTHLIYAFGGFTKDNTLKPFDKYQDIEKGGYAKFTGLKTYNKKLKTLLAIGGWNEGSTRFSPMVASREKRKEFVRNAIKFLRQNHFDGLDLDWEYPAFRDGGKPKDRENYAKLVKELREEFEKESEKTGKPRLLLTMAVPAGIEYIQKGFDVKTLNKYLDWMNLLTYDYHSAFEPAVNHHSPLYPLEEPNEYSVDNELNIDYTIKYYLENGADPDKLVLGIPTYGRSYTLFNKDAVEIGSPADGPGEQGEATREKGYLAYYEICEGLKPKTTRAKKAASDEDSEEESEEEEEEPWTVMHPNPNAMGPVAYKGNQWVGYDDVDIVRKKAEYVAENGLGGIMFWSIDNDDFRGTCHGKPYPLIEAAKEAYIVKLGSTDNSVTDRPSRASTTVRSTSNRRRNRPRPTTTTAKPASKTTKRNKSGALVSSTTPSWAINTPEPPTTPDPGSDFKCTDEGFFPHPRDCKKYFWCLDSGPSNLGIVAHQFTCPSGLFFNKAADSCDFARNVLCKKPGATTKAPTAKAITTTTTTTSPTTTASPTTRKPIKLNTKSSSLFRTTTTTTPEPEPEEEYEDDLVADSGDIEAEDPKVIKELIDLIKKVGGVEQLEKQLHLSESGSTDGAVTTTASPFHKRLYQKVLEKTRSKSKFSGNSVLETNSGATQYSGRGPQNAGLEATSDRDKLIRKDRPQYTTITRSRASTTSAPEPEQDIEDISVETVRHQARAAEEPRVATSPKPLQYVNIRRARPLATSDTADDTASRNALFERTETYVTVGETPNTLDISNARRENTPEYVTIRRQRPTTEEAVTEEYHSAEVDDGQETALEREISSPPSPSQPQYTSIVRVRSTTTTSSPEKDSPEPTTVLAVQISSLLNSPSSAEEEDTETPQSTVADVTETVPPTTTTPATTTTTTTAPTTTTTITSTTTTKAPASAPSRRTVIRRRGSSTTTQATPTSSQVSSRNYSFVRRRRPLQPNEISDSTEDDRSRRIRSTTPDSREIETEKPVTSQSGQPRRQLNRSRVRFQPAQRVDDSVPAAASPVARGKFKPQLTSDELVSLTPIDVELERETPTFVSRTFNSRTDRRFRGRTTAATSTAAAVSNIADSEASAATVETRRPTILPRGRSRFRPSSTTPAIDQVPSDQVQPVSSEASIETQSSKRPAFTRFTPRPFSRAPISTTEPEDETESAVTQRLPTRLPFGRTRVSISTTRPPLTASSVQSRRQLFPVRQSTTTQTSQSTTTQTSVSESDEEEIEQNKDDIHLSESALAEKEHEELIDLDIAEQDTEKVEVLPKRRIVIKKLRAPTSATESTVATEAVQISEDGRKRFRVIRRRPASSKQASEESVPVSTDAPAPQRIRKIIRKKIIPIEDEPEIIAKSIGSLSSAKDTTVIVTNYGEKNKPGSSTAPPPTEAPVEEEKEDENEEQEEEYKEKEEQQEEDKEKKEEKEEEEREEEEAEGKEKEYDKENEEEQERKNDEEKEKEEEIKELKRDEPEAAIKTTDLPKSDTNIVNSNSDQKQEKSSTGPDTNHETDTKPEVAIETIEKSVDLSENKEPENDNDEEEAEVPTATTTSTTTAQPSTATTSRGRVPYRPLKRVFTSTTESAPSSSRVFSRKFNPGVYTSPATVTEKSSPVTTRRSILFTRRPALTSTTKKIIEEEEEDEEEDNLEEEEFDEPEEEKPVVLVAPNQLFSRRPKPTVKQEEPDQISGEEEDEDDEEEEESAEEQPQRFVPRRPPTFKARVVNSNTFRTTSSTTELPKRTVQNRTVILNRFGANRPITDIKKRVQNVPVGYASPSSAKPEVSESTEEKEEVISSTLSSTYGTEATTETEDDDYLSMTESTTVDSNDVTSTNTNGEETTTSGLGIEIDDSTDDFLDFSEGTTNIPTTQQLITQTESRKETVTDNNITTSYTKASPTSTTTESAPETTTQSFSVQPLVKEQYDKLFSVSRVVEVNSKLDKHRLNKKNETTLVEEGKIMVEKKPTVDKIGEVSRYSLIKIYEDEIPIYLTKLGHVYPVENPPDHLIRIDEARNARALVNFADAPRENLIASESMNEAYRHINKVPNQPKDARANKGEVERIPGDDFLKYINDDKKLSKSEEDETFTQWQFVPAAYEYEKNKGAKQFEIVTPRGMLTEPSTLPLEGLFKTDIHTARRVGEKGDTQPFLVYSASLPSHKEDTHIMKITPQKTESGRNIITFAKGQEILGGPATEQATVKSPIDIISLSSEPPTTTTASLTTSTSTGPIIEMLTTEQQTTVTEPTTIALTTTTETSTTTEAVVEETTTSKSPLDAKRSKFAFPKRPAFKSSTVTRPPIIVSRVTKKNTTVSGNLYPKANNKTSTFSNAKSRFSANRAQNVPIDLRKKTTKVPQKSFSTEAPKTTTERRLYVKPIRPNLRPAFVPRRAANLSTTQSTGNT